MRELPSYRRPAALAEIRCDDPVPAWGRMPRPGARVGMIVSVRPACTKECA
ncbi:hypothetical protein ACFOEY_14350 [Paracandidimonas soli]|uniref:hypothetical protein n=1 Tax=Paracandidimonas soli TaxID=1917182 RepID=UPI003608AEFF